MILTHPLMLIGLIAVAIPIVVHLFNFRRYKKIYFSNVDYLQDLLQETRKQSTLRQLLVLLARILTIVFLVLAFAQPVKPTQKHQQLSSGDKFVSIYLDNSFSMDNTNAEGSLLDAAKQKVREIVSAYSLSDMFQLITNDAKGSEFRWLSGVEVLDALNEVESSPMSPQLSDMVAKQQNFLRESKHQGGDIYVVSDMQRSMADIDNLKLDSNVNLTLVPLVGVKVANIFIDTLTLNAPCYQRGSMVVVNVSIQNTSDETVEKVPLTLYVNGRQRAVATTDIMAKGRADVAMTFVADQDGVLNGYVETMDYPITFDDKYYFSVNVMSQRQVLVINGDSRNEYLDKLFEGDSAIKYATVKEQEINYSTLDQNNLIVLNELKSIPSGLATTLQEWVNNGGSLFIIPVAESSLAGYNQLLSLMNAPQLGNWGRGEVRVGSLSNEHPLYRNVFETQVGEVELPSVKGHYSLTTNATTHQESILSLVSGDEFLTSTQYGYGNVYVISTPLRKDYTDFGQQALVVPTLYNMALYSSYVANPSYVLGEDAMVLLQENYLSSSDICHVTDGAEVNIIPDLRRVGGRNQWWMHGEITHAGNYKVASEQVQEGVSLNYSRKESMMDFLSRDEVERSLSDNHIKGCDVVKNANKDLAPIIRQQHQGIPLWRWCVIACLLMILAEIALIKWPIKKSEK